MTNIYDLKIFEFPLNDHYDIILFIYLTNNFNCNVRVVNGVNFMFIPMQNCLFKYFRDEK